MPQPLTGTTGQPIASWNADRDLWETTQQASLLSELSDVYSETWPASGMTRSGTATALPTLEPPTPAAGCSSLLPTPEAKLGSSGPDYARATRAGSGGDDLITTAPSANYSQHRPSHNQAAPPHSIYSASPDGHR